MTRMEVTRIVKGNYEKRCKYVEVDSRSSDLHIAAARAAARQDSAALMRVENGPIRGTTYEFVVWSETNVDGEMHILTTRMAK